MSAGVVALIGRSGSVHSYSLVASRNFESVGFIIIISSSLYEH